MFFVCNFNSSKSESERETGITNMMHLVHPFLFFFVCAKNYPLQ
jgi:hypothetical protein